MMADESYADWLARTEARGWFRYRHEWHGSRDDDGIWRVYCHVCGGKKGQKLGNVDSFADVLGVWRSHERSALHQRHWSQRDEALGWAERIGDALAQGRNA